MNEKGVINMIKYTLENYSGDISDLEWSTEQIKTLFSAVKKLVEAIEDHEKINVGFGHTPGTMDYELYRVCKEVKGWFSDIKFENVKWEHNSDIEIEEGKGEK
jgi:hypothetical protein